MKLVANWPDVLRYAWSMRFIVLGAICGGAAVALPFVADLFPNPHLFAALLFGAQLGSAIFPLLAGYARVVAQPKTLGGK